MINPEKEYNIYTVTAPLQRFSLQQKFLLQQGIQQA